MNPLVKKEIRLLLPNVIICCALGLANFVFRFNNDGSFKYLWGFLLVFVFCGAMAVMLALNSFGGEISTGTFSNLLAQPISRQKIWDTKILALAISLLTVGFFWSACSIVRLKMVGHALDLLNLFTGVGVFGLAVFSGGLWTVLLLRQVAAAFWFTVLVPGFILVVIMGLFADHPNEFGDGVIACAFGLYSLAGFFFARWLFFRAQDLQWTGGAIVMPEMCGVPWLKSDGARRIWRPRAALWRKELQLHQSQFVIAFILVVLHIGVLATRHWGHFQKNSSTEFILENFWMLWLVMPMLAGAAAVAEERRLGIWEYQFCLPVKRGTQFVIKSCIVLFLSVLFGVVVPLLLEGTRILPNFHLAIALHSQLSFIPSVFWIYPIMLPSLTLAAFAGIICAVSFYASTFARNTLQALGPAVLGIVAFYFLLLMANPPKGLFVNPLWRGWLIYFIGALILIPTLIRLAFRNYQHVTVGWRMIWRNFFALAVALVLAATATSAIYHRVWERFTPIEPPHGAARLTLSNPPKLIQQVGLYSVRLPDGRVWGESYDFTVSRLNPLSWLLGNIEMRPLTNGYFLDGSNWVSVLHVQRELIGIKTDGTLWASEHPARTEYLAPGKWKMIGSGHFMRFGTETNWNSIAWMSSWSILLVKNDGTLWQWGATNWDYKLHDWPGFRAFTPYRLGAESNWADVFQIGFMPCLRKIDGSIWIPLGYALWNSNHKQTLKLAPDFSVERITTLEHGKWRSTTSIRSGLGYQLGVADDGTFRIWADQTFNSKSHFYKWTPVDLQFGKGTNWLAVAGGDFNNDEQVVTLKTDGTLWRWPFHHNDRRGWDPKRDEHEILDTKPVRLGTHADWVAIASADDGIISLAADGSLWYWRLERSYSFERNYDYGNGDGSHFEPLLGISRKPQFLGNIFGKGY